MKPRQFWSLIVVAGLLATGFAVPAGAAQGDAERADTFKMAIGGRIADPTNLNLYAPGVSRSDTGLHQLIYEYFFYYNAQSGEFNHPGPLIPIRLSIQLIKPY